MVSEPTSAHTPGPWTAQEMTHDGQPGTGFWSVQPIGEPDDTWSEADARLVAAAPELLAALKDVLTECYDDGHSASGGVGDPCQRRGQVIRCGICEALIDVRAAIAKAEGR